MPYIFTDIMTVFMNRHLFYSILFKKVYIYIMKFLKQFENWNPVVNKDVVDFIEKNKTRLLHLWNKDKSEEENMEFLTNYFILLNKDCKAPFI